MKSSILLLMVITLLSPTAMAKETKTVSKDLNLAHKGTAAIDTAFLNRAPQPATVQEFFSVARKAFGDNPKARFADLLEVRQAAEKLGITHLGGPMLGALSDDGARVWLRTLKPAQVTVLVQTPDGERSFGPTASTTDSDLTAVATVSGLKSGMSYVYRVRSVWQQSWNNPSSGFEDKGQGIFFRTRIGPCDLIMLDTRFFRTSEGKSDAFLGKDQMNWLVDQLAACTGPFIILSSGTMWSDDISNGKDSWGKWDPEGRERLLDLIEKRRIGGVILLSGDRHGARVLRIPRPSGFVFHEFELGSLGAHPGPAAMGSHPERQPFGLAEQAAFGELSFDTTTADPTMTMRVVSDDGKELYELPLSRSQLTPTKHE